jgi:Aspartyl protease
LLGVAVTVAGLSANALVDNGCGGELLISRAFASRVGIDYVNSEWERVELPDKTLLPVARTKELDLVVGPIRDRVCAVVTELVAFDVILGLPWLRRWNPVIDWRREKLLVNVGTVHVKRDIRKGSDWFMVHINAMKADVHTGLSTKNNKEKLNHE